MTTEARSNFVDPNWPSMDTAGYKNPISHNYKEFATQQQSPVRPQIRS